MSKLKDEYVERATVFAVFISKAWWLLSLPVLTIFSPFARLAYRLMYEVVWVPVSQSFQIVVYTFVILPLKPIFYVLEVDKRSQDNLLLLVPQIGFLMKALMHYIIVSAIFGLIAGIQTGFVLKILAALFSVGKSSNRENEGTQLRPTASRSTVPEDKQDPSGRGKTIPKTKDNLDVERLPDNLSSDRHARRDSQPRRRRARRADRRASQDDKLSKKDDENSRKFRSGALARYGDTTFGNNDLLYKKRMVDGEEEFLDAVEAIEETANDEDYGTNASYTGLDDSFDSDETIPNFDHNGESETSEFSEMHSEEADTTSNINETTSSDSKLFSLRKNFDQYTVDTDSSDIMQSKNLDFEGLSETTA